MQFRMYHHPLPIELLNTTVIFAGSVTSAYGNISPHVLIGVFRNRDRAGIVTDCPSVHYLGAKIMPTVLRVGPYRLFFYAGDSDEPPHVHVERDEKVAKFWLDPVRLQSSGGFSRFEIGELYRLVVKNRQSLQRAWNEYFSD